jgi:hypothetical protein
MSNEQHSRFAAAKLRVGSGVLLLDDDNINQTVNL